MKVIGNGSGGYLAEVLRTVRWRFLEETPVFFIDDIVSEMIMYERDGVMSTEI